ncbi:hypothetical protein FO519_007162 [Halicephalobus sp. NKZ332]|nr:hypothetical protein FO519_007162 [Halicephalobus sp. NKZ332]
MWAEARKTEKQVFKLFDTSAKKKEIARRIQEQNAKEPQDSLMVHGHRMRIFDDVEQESRGINNLTKWQGDESILIDRFDVRNFLESIPTKSNASLEAKTPEEFIEQMQTEYERYKELVAVDFTGDGEEQILKNIADKDHKKVMARLEKQRSKGKSNSSKPANKKVAIGFVYEDSKDEDSEDKANEEEEVQKKPSFAKPDSESESSDEEEELFSAKLGSIVFSTNDWERLNKIAEKFSIPKDAFDKLYDVDRGDELDTAKINEIERERLSISGRGGKRARARLQIRKKLILKDPLNEDAVACLKRFAERRMRKDETEDEDESSDESEFEEKVEFITSFGGEEEAPKKPKPRNKAVPSIEVPKDEDINDQKKLARLLRIERLHEEDEIIEVDLPEGVLEADQDLLEDTRGVDPDLLEDVTVVEEEVDLETRITDGVPDDHMLSILSKLSKLSLTSSSIFQKAGLHQSSGVFRSIRDVHRTGLRYERGEGSLFEGTTGAQSYVAVNTSNINKYLPLPEMMKEKFNGILFEELPIVYIKASKNNTLVHAVDHKFNYITYTSCRNEGFKNARKKTNIAGQTTGVAAGQRLLRRGINTVRVVVKGIGPGRMTAVQGLAVSGVTVVSITDRTPLIELGPRPRKIRRV